MILDYVLQGFI